MITPQEISGTYTDLYQIMMGQVYFLKGLGEHQAVFDYFFRRLPFKGGYVIFAGLQDLLEVLETLRFTEEDIRYLKTLGLHEDYLTYLKNFSFKGNVHSVPEGDVVFPVRPVIRVEANIIEAQLVETILLNTINFQSLIATKAARMRSVAGKKTLSEFGLRRAQGLGGYAASRAAIIGGFDGTSNVMAARDLDIPVSGTMAHAFVQSFGNELDAFRAFANIRPDDCTLLVDTYNTLRSGIPNAIITGKELQEQGHRLKAIRLDSGDLAYLSQQARRMLDEAGLHDVKIVASNQLDEYIIKSLEDQGAPIDIYGVGTSLVTGQPDAALDGVYKLSFFHEKPSIKISENINKTTLPGKKQVLRIANGDDQWMGADVIVLDHEAQIDMMFDPVTPLRKLNIKGYQQTPLMQPVMINGKILQHTTVSEARENCRLTMKALPSEYKRFQNPHVYKIGVSKQILDQRDDLLDKALHFGNQKGDELE